MWFKTEQIKAQQRGGPLLDPLTIGCGYLKAEERQVDKFMYWRDRLIALKLVFDEAEPIAWHDSMWSWLIWIAIFAVLLSLFLVLVVAFGAVGQALWKTS